MWKWAIYSLLCILADALDAVLSVLASNRRPQTDFLPSDIDRFSNQEIIEIREKASKPRSDSDYAVFQLTPNTVGKISQDNDEEATDASEANVLDLVFAKTTIPVPRVRRVLQLKWDHLIVMDYIKGPTLAEVWSTFSIWRKISVAFTLRRYVRQLRRLEASPATPPGPFSVQGPRTCEFKVGLDVNKVPEDHASRKEPFDDSAPLVLTHQDLNPRNIIVGEDGRLWIIDWAWSGYYPPWFEYVAMVRQADNERIIGSNHEFWESLIPFICGPYFKQEKWLLKMSWGLYYG